MKQIAEAAVVGAKIVELCEKGDKAIEEGVAGLFRKAKDGAKVEKGLFSFYYNKERKG